MKTDYKRYFILTIRRIDNFCRTLRDALNVIAIMCLVVCVFGTIGYLLAGNGETSFFAAFGRGAVTAAKLYVLLAFAMYIWWELTNLMKWARNQNI